ncbi:hypothetical protein BGZ95_001438 [Linnemannia exigua]|uniref:PS II complex 12 kDa extrinsic protein n=1 Tax=Linnemannia exigua TaxID=604196 RepID=A0AAD4D6U7_9FUNG|nr:hypothetical protein BGZ95_001438 [Linnemannia exigua]
MTFSKITTMAAAALLAVLFLGASSTHAAPVTDSLADGVTYGAGKTFGAVAGGALDKASPDALEGALDGHRYVVDEDEEAYYDYLRSVFPELAYNLGEGFGEAGSKIVPEQLREGAVDGAYEATGKE